MIRVEDFTFTYAGTASPALLDVRLDVPPGQVCAVVGANGAGKSTLCHALTGFIPHFFRGSVGGRVVVAGRSVLDTPPAELAGVVGLVFQNPFNQITGARFTVLEEVAFGLEQLGVPRAEMHLRCQEALHETGLAGLEDRSPLALSGGQMQRLALASILAMRPAVLVLDEPTSQLDPAGTRAVFQHLRQLADRAGTTVLLAEHKLEWVATVADRVVLLSGGRIVADDSARQVLSSAELEDHGLRPTQFTMVGRRLRELGLVEAVAPPPVTLSEAVAELT